MDLGQGNPVSRNTTSKNPRLKKSFPVTPPESALTQNVPLTLVESALTNSLDLKSFRIRTYKKMAGEGSYG